MSETSRSKVRLFATLRNFRTLGIRAMLRLVSDTAALLPDRIGSICFHEDLSMAILAGNGNVPRIRNESIAWLDRLEVGAKVVRKLIQDDLPLLRFVVALAGLPMKQGFTVSNQSRELVIQPNQMAGGLAKA